METTAQKLISQHERLRALRTTFDTTWQQIALRLAPSRAKFNRRNWPNEIKGQKRTELIFDATPSLALHRFAAAVHSLVTPRNTTWQKFKSSNEKLNESIAVQRYFEEITKTVFAARYAANFDNQVQECYADLGLFATMVLFIGDTGTKINYKSVPLWQCYFAENQWGVVDMMSRDYNLTARQAVAEFPRDKLPQAILNAAEKSPEVEFPFISVCGPNEDWDGTRRDHKGMAFCQYDVCLDNTAIVKEEGYTSFPYAVNRYSVAPGEVYGRGPSEIVLPDINMLNDMNRTTMQAAELRALPPLIAGQSGIFDVIRMSSGAVNYGGIDDMGRPKLAALDIKGDVGLGLEMMDQKRKVINDAFWNTLFMILVDSPSMTATEAMLRAQEKGALLAPTASRIESEFLTTVCERELAILSKRGLLPDPPDELIEAGLQYDIEYDSPMARARMAEEGIGMLRTWEQLAPIAQALGDQAAKAYRRFNVDESAKILARVNGYPARGMYSDDELAQQDEQEQQQMAAQQLLAAAPVAASAAKDLAQAQSLAASAPNQVAPGLGLQ